MTRALDGYVTVSRTGYGKCSHKCAGGSPCASTNHQHQLHTCHDELCECHALLRGAVSYDERPRRQRIALALTQGNMLDLRALIRHIGGKRVKSGVSREPCAMPGTK